MAADLVLDLVLVLVLDLDVDVDVVVVVVVDVVVVGFHFEASSRPGSPRCRCSGTVGERPRVGNEEAAAAATAPCAE